MYTIVYVPVRGRSVEMRFATASACLDKVREILGKFDRVGLSCTCRYSRELKRVVIING